MNERRESREEKGLRQSTALVFAIAAALLFSSLAAPAHALGASPARLSFESVLPGGYAQAGVLLSNPRDEPALVQAAVEGDGAAWINVTILGTNGSAATLVPLGTARLLVTLTPPPDAEPKEYDASVVLTTSAAPAAGGASGGASSALALSMSIPVTITVESVQRPACVLGGVSVPDFEQGEPLQILYAISDTGNTRITPSGNLTISDGSGSQVYVATVDAQGSLETLPTRIGQYTFVATPSLSPGTYHAQLTVDQCGATQQAAFSVLAPGALTDQGAFTSLSSSAAAVSPSTIPPNASSSSSNASSSSAVANPSSLLQADVGSILPVEATFTNSGARAVTARFSGVVEQDGKVVRVLESEPLLVQPGQDVTLQSYFTPAVPGDYTVRGSVVYEGKRTEERSFAITVSAASGSDSIAGSGSLTVLGTTLLFLIVIAAVVLLVLIQNKRHKR